MLSPFRKEESMGKKGNSEPHIPERRSARFNNSEEDDKNGGLRKAKKSSSSEVAASKLSLQLIDENNKTVNLPEDEAEAIKLPSATVTVYLDWTPELSGMYDITCLESLPEVLKYGPATKKARSEPLSLYACLEAFLREEPLVPDEVCRS
uniref:Ubiquitin carboxyl-terminal hydrolase 5 n=1 Tax=Noccaea caerulescens TaxID=107243 RepID=A0A1J3DYE7_NOCCA